MECASDEKSASPSTSSDLSLSQVSKEKNTLSADFVSNLAASGPGGTSAAAAIVSKKKCQVNHHFEHDPFLRKKKKNYLLRKLRRLIHRFISNVGGHVVFVVVPSKTNRFKIIGTTALMKTIMEMKTVIIKENQSLNKTFHLTQPKHLMNISLPLLTAEGLHATINKMTQSQLRSFIPRMIRCFTKKYKIGWEKEDNKPTWWPNGLPWKCIRLDRRSEEEKKKMSWTNVLRQIVIACYRFHGKEHFLYSLTKNNVSSLESPSSSGITGSAHQIIQTPNYENIIEQDNEIKNSVVDLENNCECTNAAKCVEEVICGNEISSIFTQNNNNININDQDNDGEAATNIVENSFNYTTKFEEGNRGKNSESLNSVLNDQPNEDENILDPDSLPRVDANDAVFLDFESSNDHLTYIIPLMQVQPPEANEGEIMETFIFAEDNVATHSLVVQVNSNDNLFINEKM